MKKNNFVPYGPYLDILNVLGEWKILNVKELKKLYHGETNCSILREKIRKLERHGFLKSTMAKGKAKYLFLTPIGLKLCFSRYSERVNERNITHDLITAQVLREFLKWPHCLDGQVLSSRGGYGIHPDAEIFVLAEEGKKIKVALEIELTRKSYGRIIRKFGLYRRDSEYDRVLFITRHENIFRGYGNYLTDTREDIQEKIALVLDSKLSIEKFDWKNLLCLYMGKKTDLLSVFSENGK